MFVDRVATYRRAAICPVCESGELVGGTSGGLVHCAECARDFGTAVLETILEIVFLPDAAGRHPCECGHPEMRALPDGVFHCPACRSEVLPPGSSRMLA